MGDVFSRQPLVRTGLFMARTTRPVELRALVRALRVTPIEQRLIRVGSCRDGGYLLPDDLHGVQHCFSPGVAACSDFECDLANRGMRVCMADRSVDGPAAAHPRFQFIKKFLASTDDPDEGLITLDTWYREAVGPVAAQAPEAVLQMDIEGAEYEVLHNVSDVLLQRFRIVVIEFHRLHQLADRYAFRWMSGAFRKLLRHHAVVHIHPNNNRRILLCGGLRIPATMEFTFLRRDRIQAANHPPMLPNPLDCRNVASKPDLVLPACWYA